MVNGEFESLTRFVNSDLSKKKKKKVVDRDQIGIISRIKIRECLIKFDYCIRGNVEFWINDEQINSGFNNCNR